MVSIVSDTLAKNMLDVAFGRASSIAPASYWAGLCTTAPGDGSGSGLVEVDAGGYLRVEIPNNSTNWPGAMLNLGLRQKSNGTVIQFPEATGEWGTCSGLALFDSDSGGAFMAYGDFTTPQMVVTGNLPFVSAGALHVQL